LLALVLHLSGGLPIFVAAALAAGAIAGGLSSQREQQILLAAVRAGPIRGVAIALTDSKPSRFGGVWFLARPYALEVRGEDRSWQGPPILVSSEQSMDIDVGYHIRFRGSIISSPGFAAGSPYAGKLKANDIEVVRDAGIFLVAGTGLRHRVTDRLAGRGPPAALLSGFLVGDTTQLPPIDLDALRRSGVAHFVAVSGANVAGFLFVWWLLLGPLAVGPRRRGLWGLLALGLFVVATRWEPSVVRASLMAGTVLAGRVLNLPIDSWTALGLSGTLALLVSPELAGDLGFQLSVLATAGIMMGADVLPESVPKRIRAPLGATISAQVAVTPLLLINFGSVPMAAPLTNLLTAPLVAAATLLGGIGALVGIEPVLTIALALASAVLDLAHWAAWFPQIGAIGFALCLLGAVAIRSMRWRPLVVVSAALAISLSVLPGAQVSRPSAIFLDVGQGDAALILGSTGKNVLVDGGPDPVLLTAALRRYQVHHLDLVVLTHPHEDHAAGLVGLVARFPIDRIWYPGPPHSGLSWEIVIREAGYAGVLLEVPEVGQMSRIGDLTLEVLGPQRRYDGINNQSVVLLVSAGGPSLLMTGDIEAAAQADLSAVEAEVLKVPHHGGATSDLSWLRSVDASLAIVSVGPNNYGHPSADVIAVMVDSGAILVRTDEDGDVVVPLLGDPTSGGGHDIFWARQPPTLLSDRYPRRARESQRLRSPQSGRWPSPRGAR
jgi:competence protein ComEC